MSKQSDLVGVSQGSAGDPLYVDSTNNKVGIGTSSPDTALNIGFSGADQSNALRIEGSNGSSERYALDIEADGEYAKTNFKIGVGGGAPTTRMTIDSSGNVGIGTSPATGVNLHLHEAGSGQMLMAFTNDTTGSGSNDGLHVGIDSSENSFVYNKQNTTLYFGTNNTERMRIDASGRVTMPYQPAFRAHTFTPMSGIGTIVYTVAAHNIGSHYNTSTGRFTAPVAGVYHFDFSVLMAAGSNTHYIRVLFAINGVRNETRNGDTLTGGVPGAFTNYNYHAVNMSHNFYLNANDTVEVSAQDPNGQTYSSGGFGSFSGYLIG